jgi:hypothetical protein
VARVRQARRCHARRSDGQPCRAWAIIGGTVCRVHGGSTRRARYRAYVNRTEASIRREFEAAKARWRRDLITWQARRILTTSELLGMSAHRVTPADIAVCRILHGVPAAPRPVMRTDRRYGPRVPGRY